MTILALDLSLTAAGWARSTWDHGTIRPRSKGVARLQEVLTAVVNLARSPRSDLVVIEGYSFGSQGRSIISLGELGGVIRLGLHQLRIPFVEISPPTLKKFATGKGNAGKGAVLVEAVKRLGYDGADDNEADALWLLQAARIHYELPGAAELPKVQRDAILKVEWPRLRSTA